MLWFLQIYTRKLYISAVASFAEAWIEMIQLNRLLQKIVVASFAEAWIEIIRQMPILCAVSGRFLRGSVDWNSQRETERKHWVVASFAEAWIEIVRLYKTASASNVASFAEAWIEIYQDWCKYITASSLPSRKRGLKSTNWKRYQWGCLVASFAEAWIEIYGMLWHERSPYRRFLRGSVDWNPLIWNMTEWENCRFLRGSVDWNFG